MGKSESTVLKKLKLSTKYLILVASVSFIFFAIGVEIHSDYAQATSQGSDPGNVFFAGYSWNVKSSPTQKVGPGPNYFSGENVWVDNEGRLHLSITYRNGKWYSAEVFLDESLGHGEYTYYVNGLIDRMDENIVFSPTLYRNSEQSINLEFAKWGNPLSSSGAYAVKRPSGSPAHTFSMNLNGAFTTHKILWTEERVHFQSIHGHHLTPSRRSSLIDLWTYPNPETELKSIPKGDLKPNINFWLHRGNPPTDGSELEIIISDFKFRPYSE